MRKYTDDELIQVRQYGINDLNSYINKLRANIKVFEDAIAKERNEIKRAKVMIKDLKEDQKVQRKILKMTSPAKPRRLKASSTSKKSKTPKTGKRGKKKTSSKSKSSGKRKQN